MQDYKPLIVQSDKTLLLDVHAPGADDCRDALIPFAELERSPEHLHTYRLTPLSLWNAASAGFSAADAVDVLKKFARYDVPQSVCVWIEETANRFGRLRLIPDSLMEAALAERAAEQAESADKADDASKAEPPLPETLLLVTDTALIYKEICASKVMKKYLTPIMDPADGQFAFRLKLVDRGTVKQELIKLGWPVRDEVPLRDGEPLDVSLRDVTLEGKPLVVRDYQKGAADALVGNMGPGTGYGTIVLPCGSGKTMVGMTVMDRIKTSTLILTTNISAVHQWIDELVDKTNLTRDQIGEYTGEVKDIKPVTVAT